MKRTEILKQTYECGNNFDTEAMYSAIRHQVGSKIFKELINGQKHSLSLEFRVFVNEEEREDKDPKLVDLIDCVNLFKEMIDKKSTSLDVVKESLKRGNTDLFDSWMRSVEICTSKY